MAGLEDEAAQTEETVATAAASAEAEDVISNTCPAVDTEVATRPAATEVEMREMKAELKDFMEADWMKQTDNMMADHKQQNEELQNLYNGKSKESRGSSSGSPPCIFPLRETRSKTVG